MLYLFYYTSYIFYLTHSKNNNKNLIIDLFSRTFILFLTSKDKHFSFYFFFIDQIYTQETSLAQFSSQIKFLGDVMFAWQFLKWRHHECTVREYTRAIVLGFNATAHAFFTITHVIVKNACAFLLA